MARNGAVFTAETFRFFRELARNNRKDWMDANRERYQQHIVAPFRVLLERLTPAVLRMDPDFDTSGRTGRNFSRINRDIRFARDKSPYRTQMYLLFSHARDSRGETQLYVGVSAEAVTAGLRIYNGRDSRLRAVASLRALQNLPWLTRQARRLGRKYESYWYATEKGEWAKRPGWPTAPEAWKRIRGWVVRRKWKPVAATRPAFLVEVSKVFRELFPLYRFCTSPAWKP